MRITSVRFSDFKRFKNLTIKDLPETARLVMLVGPNGSGKSSVFDGFLQWQRKVKFGPSEEQFEYWMRGSDPVLKVMVLAAVCGLGERRDGA